jgi:hypothetical protein
MSIRSIIFWGFIVVALNPNTVFAQLKADKKAVDTVVAKKDSMATAIKNKKKIDGLFALYQDSVTGSLQFYVKKNQLGKEYIYQSFAMGGPGSLFLNQNMLRETWVLKMKRSYNKIEFLRCNANFYYDPNNAISKAANVDVSDAVFYASKITAEDSTGYLVSVDGLFVSEKLDPVKPVFPPTIPPGSVFNLGNFNAEKSGYEKIRSFPNNTDIIVSLAYDNPAPLNYGDKSITDARYVRVKMQHSFLEMPDNDYQPRFDDPRVGFFTQELDDMTSVKATNYHDLINRWYLKKKDPSAALSEPVEPIVWWVENTTPVELRQVILDAGNKWNEAFEKAGFKNAVVMKMMPDTASWDPADIRYNVIRWVSSDLGYAIGPSFVNPRTGQILGADITIDFGFMGGTEAETELYNGATTGMKGIEEDRALSPQMAKHLANCTIGNGLRVQYAAGTVMAECMGAGEAELKTLKEQFFNWLVLHEMGHTMGLMHNMKSSQMLSPAELHDKNITRKYGLTGSVMDYPTVNASLDPAKQGDYYSTKTGPYDLWAIEYGYSTFAPAAEQSGLQKILDRSTEPHLIFGNDADISSYSAGIDPRVNVWEMSNDMVVYGTERFKLVNQLMGKLKTTYAKPENSYADLRMKYTMLNNQRYSMAVPLSKYIGGIYVDRSFAGQKNAAKPFTPVPVEYQKKALTVLSTYLFAPGAFDADTYLLPYLQRQRRSFNFSGGTEDMKIENMVLSLQMGALNNILSPVTTSRINNTSLYGNTYSVADVMGDLVKSIFDADKNGAVNLYRQNLQTEFVKTVAAILNTAPGYDNATRAASLNTLKKVKTLLASAVSPNEQTKAHRLNLNFIVDKALLVK